jgi:hypothetical protein
MRVSMRADPELVSMKNREKTAAESRILNQ